MSENIESKQKVVKGTDSGELNKAVLLSLNAIAVLELNLVSGR